MKTIMDLLNFENKVYSSVKSATTSIEIEMKLSKVYKMFVLTIIKYCSGKS